MSDFELIEPAQLDALRAIIRSGTKPLACEIVAVRWPAPTGTRYYSFAPYDQIPGFREGLAALGIEVEIRKAGGYFLDLHLTDETNDDTVPLELLDHDRAITQLMQQHGTGHQVEIYIFFPQIDALVSLWHGHLRPPQEGGTPIMRASASAGFRNSQVLLPRRVLFTGTCQAPHFDHADCGYSTNPNRLDDPATGLPFVSCPQNSRAVCAARQSDDLSFMAADTIIESVYNGQTRGGPLYPISKANESNLKEPLRVIFGERKVKDLPVSAYTRQTNTKHPDKGFIRAVIPTCEGPIRSMRECSINDRLIGFEHLNVRLGHLRQPRTGFSPNVSNMSGTAHFFGVWGQVDPAQYNASNLRGSCRVEGLTNIRVYSDPDNYVETYAQKRSWALMEILRNERWGRGYQDSRLHIPDWIALSEWDGETVKYKLADGTERSVVRSSFNAELVGRPGADQIRDVCLYGRYGKPFRHNGQVRCVPLKKETIDDSIPVFTDEGPEANIVIEEKSGSQLFWSQVDLADLPNELVLNFEDAAHGNIERPLTFRDQQAQQSAAAALGDRGVHVVRVSKTALGVTNEGEAIRLGWMLLNLGEFDGEEKAGLLNNLRVRFLTNAFETLNLRKYQLIKIVSPKIAGFGFEYFRVMKRQRKGNLYAEVQAQAYPVEYYEQMEDTVAPPVLPEPVILPNPGGAPGDRPFPIPFDSISFTNDRIQFRLALNVL